MKESTILPQKCKIPQIFVPSQTEVYPRVGLCSLGWNFAPLGLYYSPRYARGSKVDPREQSPTLGSKVLPSGKLLPEMEKKSSGFFISDNGKRHCLPDFLTYFLIIFPQQQIIDLDEKNQLLKANIWLNYHWVDVNLSWNEVSKLTSNKTLYYKKFCLATE